jgi:hypothetical protein
MRRVCTGSGVFNVPEGAVDATLVNAPDVEAVKERQTDVLDCE